MFRHSFGRLLRRPSKQILTGAILCLLLLTGCNSSTARTAEEASLSANVTQVLATETVASEDTPIRPSPAESPTVSITPAHTTPADQPPPTIPGQNVEGNNYPGPATPLAAPTQETYPADEDSSFGAPLFGYEILAQYPHDPLAYTQGLVVEGGEFLEGTGLNGSSSLRRVETESGRVAQFLPLEDKYFGEGITVFENRIYQLTWLSQTGFVYDAQSFELLETFDYPGEGWGLTHDGQRLIMSDGTAELRFLDPDTLDELGRLLVADNQGPVTRLNELEYVNGEILANIYTTDLIARISPLTGEVLGYIDFTGLLSAEQRTGQEDVLNGIAYDDQTDRLFITGKRWPLLFEVAIENLN